MFGSTLLEVAIGLTFIYVLLSLACSGINEMISQLLKLRAATLQQGIEQLITDPAVRVKFYEHPLIKSLSKKRKFKVLNREDISYIPNKNFMMAFFSAVSSVGELADSTPPSDGSSVDVFETLEKQIADLKDSDMKTSLMTFIQGADKKVDTLKKDVDEWFDSVMSQTSEWYKRRAQVILVVLGLTVTVALNADTIELAKSFWQNPALRQTIVAAADNYVTETQSLPQREEALDTVQAQLDAIDLPISWTAETTPSGAKGWLLKIFGLLFTGVAVSQGAPFWFDLLRKLVSLRKNK